MIDNFALALSHGLMLLAAWRLLRRPDLDDSAAPPPSPGETVRKPFGRPRAGACFKRPFLFVLAYAYVDIVAPQHLSYYLLNSIQISMVTAALAVAGWLIADDKRHFVIAPRQWLMLALLAYAGFTTVHADMPDFAPDKWDWVWKGVAWAIFLPFTLRTRLRVEAYLLFMTLSASAIIIVGGIKTAASGGGYGALNLMVTSNSGLYEGSTISTVAIAIVPIILWLARYGTIYPRDWRVRLFAYNLIFACLLIPVGTEARTGLVCIAVLTVLNAAAAAFYYLRVVVYMFMREPVAETEPQRHSSLVWAGLWATTVLTIVLGLVPGPLLSVVTDAAKALTS